MSAEVAAADPADPLGPAWRHQAAAQQERALPAGKAVVTCSAPFGVGGLGRHLSESVEAFERSGEPAARVCGMPPISDSPSASSAVHRRSSLPSLARVLAGLHVPTSPGMRMRAFVTEFDAAAARQLPRAEHLVAFNGQALAQFRTARRAGYTSLTLVSANSHLRRVTRQHARAHELYPLEGSWASQIVERNLIEYKECDRIYVASRYTRESFLEEGFEDEKLCLFQFTPDPRYRPWHRQPGPDTFDIVYIGSLSVAKGVPLLIDAVRRLPYEDLRLVLVGGWGTRGMRRFTEAAVQDDPRISVRPGDPLPHLRRANVCVHPSFEDGFAYAPAEALACGVPVIVTDDTGMKDLIAGSSLGSIIPTGDLDALTEAIEAAFRGELFAGNAALGA
jgi:glycosyltransferase involved in cell wall biosynthesis